jgi:hypothetical protein
VLDRPEVALIHSTKSKRLQAYRGGGGLDFAGDESLVLFTLRRQAPAELGNDQLTTDILVTSAELVVRSTRGSSLAPTASWRVAWRDVVLFEPSLSRPLQWTVNAQPGTVSDETGTRHDGIGPLGDAVIPSVVVDLLERIRVYLILSENGAARPERTLGHVEDAAPASTILSPRRPDSTEL